MALGFEDFNSVGVDTPSSLLSFESSVFYDLTSVTSQLPSIDLPYSQPPDTYKFKSKDKKP